MRKITLTILLFVLSFFNVQSIPLYDLTPIKEVEIIDLDPTPGSLQFNQLMKNISETENQSNPKETRGDNSFVSESDSLALVALYNSTNGNGWETNTNWLYNPVNSWYGIVVKNGNIIEIDISDNELTGSIPVEIANLVSLKKFKLRRNQITGIIPTGIGNLDSLEYLDLSYNEISGPIPSGLATLDSLEYIYLSWNQLTGTILPELQNLSKLKRLYLSFNQLTGTIPSELGTLPILEHLSLSGNQLSGNIPSSLGNLTNLTVLKLFNNNISGNIPSELGALLELYWLALNDNKLTGNIPIEICNLIKLSIIDFSVNYLSGELPSNLGNLVKLRELYLDNNSFTNGIDLSFATNIGELKINANQLTFGDLEDFNIDFINTNNPLNYNDQAELPEPTQNISVDDLILSFNTDGAGNTYQWFKNGILLEGETASELTINKDEDGIFYCEVYNSNFPELILSTKPIYKNINTTQGIITEEYNILVEFYNSTNGNQWKNNINWLSDENVNSWLGITSRGGHIINIELSDNKLTGFIPSQIGELYSLIELDLSFNQITGSIPSTLSNISTLINLKLNSNLFENSIPIEFGNFLSLENLIISSNQLTGSIPSQLGNISTLKELSLSSNLLSGIIPSELGNLSSLQSLYLGSNNFTGSVPEELGNLLSLEKISLYSSNLSGIIPPDLSNLTNLESIDIRKNNFTGMFDLSNMTKLWILHIDQNNFTFCDFDSTNININNIGISDYSPQNTLELETTNINIIEGENLTLNCQDITVESLSHVNNEFAIFNGENMVYGWSNNPEYNISSTFNDEGKYTIQVKNSIYPELVLSSDTLTIKINHAPTSIDLSANSIDENSAIGSVIGQFSTTDIDNGDSFTYSFITGDGTNDADNDSFTIDVENLKTVEELDFETQSEYKIYIQTEDAGGLTFEKAFVISVNDLNETGLFDIDNLECIVYPNPSNGNFTLEFNKEKYQVKVYDIVGNLVYHKTATSPKHNVNMSRIAKGTYIIVIQNNDKVLTKKLQIQ